MYALSLLSIVKIPFVDLRGQTKRTKPGILDRFNRLMEESNFILGKEVETFEHSFANYNGVTHAVGVGSGLDAIALSLKAVDIGSGDEVIIPAHTCIATALGISQTGAIPVLVDIQEENYCLDSDQLEKAITPKTKAIIPVHLYGQMMDLSSVTHLAKQYDLKVIEDAAQAHGAKRNGQRAGSVGVMGCFSFYPSKNLGCFGDGGAIITNSETLRDRIFLLRNYGSRERNSHTIKGGATRLDALQAAVLNEKLRDLDQNNKLRYDLATQYDQALRGIGDLVLPQIPAKGLEENSHVFHLYVIRTKRRNALLSYLRNKHIGVEIHYPMPIHRHQAYAELKYTNGSFPVAERICSAILSLPIFPYMEQDQLEYVVDQIKNFFMEC